MSIFIDQSTMATGNITISNHLPTNDTIINLSTTSISTSNLSKPNNLFTAATSNLSATNHSKLEIGNGSELCSRNLSTSPTQNLNSQNYLSLLVIPENATSNKTEFNQQTTLTNILPAMITENEALDIIFSFEFEELSATPLFSEAALKEKPITVMYIDAKVDGHPIKLILNSAASAKIITADGATKTPIGEINNFPFEVNGIIILIKVLVMEATQYQALVDNDWNSNSAKIANTHEYWQPNVEHNELPPILNWEKKNNNNDNKNKSTPTSWEEKRKRKKEDLPEETNKITKKITSGWERKYLHESVKKPPYIFLKCQDYKKKFSSIEAWIAPDKDYWTRTHYYCKPCDRECYDYPKQQSKWDNELCLTCGKQLLDKRMWNDIPSQGGTCDTSCQYTILISDWVSYGMSITAAWHRAISRLEGYPHNKDEIWQMANAKVEETMSSKILKIKNNLPKQVDIILIPNPDAFLNIETNPEDFHKHYQNLYCNECDLIYNPPSCMIYTIPEEIKPISNCVSESESIFNPDSNSNNDDNNSSSSVQYGNEINSNLDSNPNYKQYIALSDLSKEQELKWYSNNDKSIMLECAHDIDAGFDLRYSGKDAIKLEPHLHTCINLKIALEILTTTMVQLAFRNSLAKKRINIRGGIIDTEYVGNIMAMLQNDSEKTYIIKPNKKIAQAIFLPLVKIAQLVSVENREELEITARGIQGFGSTGKIDVLVNMIEEKTIGQEKFISIGQAISILPYDQYIIVIERKVKNQAQIFEAEASLCKSEGIGLINLDIPAKNHNHIKIPIYNNTGNVVEIPEGTTIRYLTTEIEDQPPNTVPDFLQLCEYVDITSQTIYE
ncbi:hypothetical protein G9A89_004607 [Geosiphon pyriformis]|nr:hypothetical protein G9A89_004607 [Geosiphon pyriformis]